MNSRRFYASPRVFFFERTLFVGSLSKAYSYGRPDRIAIPYLGAHFNSLSYPDVKLLVIIGDFILVGCRDLGAVKRYSRLHLPLFSFIRAERYEYKGRNPSVEKTFGRQTKRSVPAPPLFLVILITVKNNIGD